MILKNIYFDMYTYSGLENIFEIDYIHYFYNIIYQWGDIN